MKRQTEFHQSMGYRLIGEFLGVGIMLEGVIGMSDLIAFHFGSYFATYASLNLILQESINTIERFSGSTLIEILIIIYECFKVLLKSSTHLKNDILIDEALGR